MKPKKIARLRSYVAFADFTSAALVAKLYGARFDFRAGAYEMRLAGVTGTSTMSREAAKESWVRAARKRIAQAEDDCPGHIAGESSRKTCGRCGIHIDELRPDDDDPINLAGSGPVPIEPREG